jgi:hypothetical protein
MTQALYNIPSADIQLFDRLSSKVAQLEARIVQLERLENSQSRAPCGIVTHSASQTTTTGVNLTLAYDTAIDNNFGYWSSGTNTRLTVPTGYAGVHLVTLSVRWNANATGYRLITVRLNGATPLAINIDDASGSEAASTIAFPYRFAAGDYIDSYVRQTSGGNLNVAALSQYSPVLAMTRLGA